ncbi:MAG: hypothetical protein RSD40_04885, partial [Bacilli bacterium]
FSSDNKDSSLVTERKEEITKSVLKAALADTYFSLSSAEIKKLSSGRGVDLMIERALNPKDRKTGEKLAEYMRECVGDNFYVKERIDWFSQIPYAGPLQVAAENFKAISPDGHSPLVESELLIKSRKVDIEATKERLKNKNPDTIGLINKTGNSLNDDYFQSQVELVARYTEGQIYPDIVSSSRDGNAYSIKKDKNFDKLREELISCFFGKDAVKEPEYPENVKLIWEKQNNPNFLKTKKVEINSVPSRFEKVVDYLKEKPAQKLAEMFKSVQSIYEKQKNKEVNAQAPESDVTKITMRVNEVRMNIKESSPTSQETSSLKRGNKL